MNTKRNLQTELGVKCLRMVIIIVNVCTLLQHTIIECTERLVN